MDDVLERKGGRKSCPLLWLFLLADGAFAFVVLWFWVLLGDPILRGLQTTGLSLGQFIQWRGPEFQEAFWGSLRKVLAPWWAWRFAGPGKWLLLAVCLLTAAVFLSATWRTRIDARPCLRIALLGLPVFLGILMWPLEIKHGFRTLAAAGLTSQRLLGAAIAEPFAHVVLGGLASLLACGALLRGPGLRGNPSPQISPPGGWSAGFPESGNVEDEHQWAPTRSRWSLSRRR